MVTFSSNSPSPSFSPLAKEQSLTTTVVNDSPKSINEKEKEQNNESFKKNRVSVLSPFKKSFKHIWASPFFDEKLYITTNEMKQRETLALLSFLPLVPDSRKPAMVAFSSFCGLNLAAVRNIKFIIMIDRSVRVKRFWEEMEKIIVRVSNNEEAIREIVTTLTEKSTNFWPDCPCGNDNCQKTSKEIAKDRLLKLKFEVMNGESWLSSQEKFAKIKSIFDKGNFIFKRIDFFDFNKIRVLSKTVKKLGLTLDLFYLSNIREYAKNSNKLYNFEVSMNKLFNAMTEGTLIVDTKPRLLNFISGQVEPLEQRVVCQVQGRPIPLNSIHSPFASKFKPAMQSTAQNA